MSLHSLTKMWPESAVKVIKYKLESEHPQFLHELDSSGSVSQHNVKCLCVKCPTENKSTCAIHVDLQWMANISELPCFCDIFKKKKSYTKKS